MASLNTTTIRSTVIGVSSLSYSSSVRPPLNPTLYNTTTTTVAPTPLKTSSLAANVVTSTFLTTSLPGLNECSSILGKNTTIMNNSNNGQRTANKTPPRAKNVLVSTSDRKVGTIVRVECETRGNSQSVIYLRCQESGQWNGTLPECVDHMDISSFKVYFTVAGIVSGLTVFVLLTLLCYILLTRKRKSTSSSETSGESEKNIYVDPCFVSDALARSSSGEHYARSDISYDKPVVYTTFLNSSFYEDAYDRWRKQESSVTEKFYDSPWEQQRGLKAQMDTPDFKWSQPSLKTLSESDFRKLPRAQLSIDHASVKSTDTIGPVSGSYLNDSRVSQSMIASHRPQYVPKRNQPMGTHDTRRDLYFDKTVTGVPQDDDSQSTMVEIDAESNDGVTNL